MDPEMKHDESLSPTRVPAESPSSSRPGSSSSPRKKKAWLRLVFAAAALVVLAIVAALEPVDYSPYVSQGYYKHTLSSVQGTTAGSVVTGELRAGFGRALLTPALSPGPGEHNNSAQGGVPLAGYGARQGKPAVGVHDDVYVKAVAFKVEDRIGVMVGADALIIPRDVAERALAELRERPGLLREQVYFGATHTHSSLGGWGKGWVAESFAGHYNEHLSKWFSDHLVAAARAALKDLQPAVLGSGSFRAPQFVRNRLVGETGGIDPEFRFEVLKQTTTGQMAVIGSYAAHATVLPARNMQFSADYPGYWQRAVERATGGMALFLAGGVGSHSPNPGGVSGFEGAEKMGNGLAELVAEQLPRINLTNVVILGIRGLEVMLPPPNARITDQLRFRPWLAERLLPVSDRTFVQAFRLNQTVWISTPCDFSGELALELKDYARARGFECAVTSFNGDYIGYVIPGRYYHLGGYEPRIMSFYGPYTADYLQEMARRLAGTLWN